MSSIKETLGHTETEDLDFDLMLSNLSLKDLADVIKELDTELSHIVEDELYHYLLKKYLPKEVYSEIDDLVKTNLRWFA